MSQYISFDSTYNFYFLLNIFYDFSRFPFTWADKVSIVTAQKSSDIAGPLVIFSVGILELVEHCPQVLPGVVEPLLLADCYRRIRELSHG